MRENGTLYWLLGDHLGSTSITATEDGMLHSEVGEFASQIPFAYGEIRYSTNITPTDYLYTGQRMDSYINLYWYGSRWYDPYLNHFTQPDTIIPDPYTVQDWNRYNYTRFNPVTYNGALPQN